MRVVVVGGGVAGLTAAYRLLSRAGDAAPEVTVLEASDRPGGKVRSIEVGGLSVEAGPDSFVARKPWAVGLCREVGLGGDLVAPAASGAFLWTDLGLVPFPPDSPFGIPGDIVGVLRWPGLSRGGRLRAARDLVQRARKDTGDESLGSLLRRRLGDEATELALGPLLAGLFAGDVDRLSVQATFPELAEWERTQGSLIRGAQAAHRSLRESTPGPMFLRPAQGLDRLIDALAGAVGRQRILTGVAATTVRTDGTRLVVEAERGSLPADAVVLAVPSFVAAKLVRGHAEAAASALGSISHVSTAVVLLVYPEGTGDALPDAAGFVVPAGKAPMTAATFLSRKWPRSSFGDRAVVRCFVGAAGSEDILRAPEEDIVQAVCRHLSAVVDLPDRPASHRVVTWERAMPQYDVGHLARVKGIEEALPRGIFVAGSSYRGAGIADAVRQGGEAAERILGLRPARTLKGRVP